MHDYVLVSLVWVGSNLIIPDMGYASWKMVKMTLQLVLAFKRLLCTNIPQGNIELLRSWVVTGKYSPRSTHTWLALAYLSCDQLNEPTSGFGLENAQCVNIKTWFWNLKWIVRSDRLTVNASFLWFFNIYIYIYFFFFFVENTKYFLTHTHTGRWEKVF